MAKTAVKSGYKIQYNLYFFFEYFIITNFNTRYVIFFGSVTTGSDNL